MCFKSRSLAVFHQQETGENRICRACLSVYLNSLETACEQHALELSFPFPMGGDVLLENDNSFACNLHTAFLQEYI